MFNNVFAELLLIEEREIYTYSILWISFYAVIMYAVLLRVNPLTLRLDTSFIKFSTNKVR